MRFNEKLESKLTKGLPFAITLLRIITAWRLWSGTWPYVSGLQPVADVTGFFKMLNIPLPEFNAYVSLYVQFIGSVLLFVGWQTRLTAFLLAINFTVALLAAHLHDSIEKSFQAWALWAIAIFFMCNGGGKFSLDQLGKKRIAG